jgi:hypothetical protein
VVSGGLCWFRVRFFSFRFFRSAYWAILSDERYLSYSTAIKKVIYVGFEE